MSPKWKPASDSQCKYNKDWENKYSWLMKAPNELNEEYCKLRHCTLTPKFSNIADHEKTEKHKKRLPKQGKQLINFTSTSRSSHKFDDSLKKQSIYLAATIACHSTIRSVDLGEIIARHGSGSVWENKKLHLQNALV